MERLWCVEWFCGCMIFIGVALLEWGMREIYDPTNSTGSSESAEDDPRQDAGGDSLRSDQDLQLLERGAEAPAD